MALTTQSTQGNPPFRRLLVAKIKQKGEKRLCYYYDKKYNPNHKYKPTFLLLIGEEEMVEILQGFQRPIRRPSGRRRDLNLNA